MLFINTQELVDNKELFTLLSPEILMIKKPNHELLKPLPAYCWLNNLQGLFNPPIHLRQLYVRLG